MNRIVYLDYAATSPLCEEAAHVMASFFRPGIEGLACNANANSLYDAGRAAFQALEAARKELAAALGVKPHEIIFTSGATEADNAAVFGIARAETARRRQAGRGKFTPRVIASAIEHPAVRRPAKQLAREGYDVVFLAPDREGFVSPERLAEAMTPDTVLVSIQWANAEVGSIQPIEELAAIAHSAGALFHSDATQAFGKIPLSITDAGIDAASFSAHKIGGPKGVGILYLKARTPFESQLLGGGQESSHRSGTQNVAGAVGFAAAARASMARLHDDCALHASMRDRLYRELSCNPRVVITNPQACGSDDYLPNIVHVMVRDMESETLVLRLSNAGICVSGGSACSSGSLEPSGVLTALGVQRDLALGALRISLGRYTNELDITRFLEAFPKVLI